MTKQKTNYFNRESKPISLEDWRTLQNDPRYKIVRQYDNGKVHLSLNWTGKVVGEQWPDLRPIFTMSAWNYMEDGRRIEDMNMHGKTYPSERIAVEEFEAFLAKWSECEMDELTGEFIEEGNTLAPPPPPPTADTPHSEEALAKIEIDDGGIGAW